MPIAVTQAFKNLQTGLEIPSGDLVILTGPNNSGKSAILQYLNIHSPERERCDYVSPRRFDISNEVSIALNTNQELRSLFNQRKQWSETISELTAPDPIREMMALPNAKRQQVIDWHNRYFGELSIVKADPENDFSPPRIGRLPTQQGSGSRAVLGVLVSLLHPERDIALIDEPEIGVEPQVQKRLFELIKKAAQGADGLPRKRVYLATHSHLFLDRESLGNNYIVTRDVSGYAAIKQVTTAQELHSLVYHLLGNSPTDLFFPDNILVVEGPSDQIFWRRLLEISGAGGISVHYSDGDAGIGAALPAIEQMLKTQAYVPWYKERLCVIVDSSVSQSRLAGWKRFLGDNGSRVRNLSKNGIEHFYPRSLLAEISGLQDDALDREIEQFLRTLRGGQRIAQLGAFSGSKRDLALTVSTLLENKHIGELSPEITEVLEVVRAHRFLANRTATMPAVR